MHQFEIERKITTTSDCSYLCVVAATHQQISVRLFSEVMALKMEFPFQEATFFEFNLAYTEIRDRVKSLLTGPPRVVIFEMIYDHRYLSLVADLLNSKFKVWIGVVTKTQQLKFKKFKSLSDLRAASGNPTFEFLFSSYPTYILDESSALGHDLAVL